MPPLDLSGYVDVLDSEGVRTLPPIDSAFDPLGGMLTTGSKNIGFGHPPRRAIMAGGPQQVCVEAAIMEGDTKTMSAALLESIQPRARSERFFRSVERLSFGFQAAQRRYLLTFGTSGAPRALANAVSLSLTLPYVELLA